MAPIKKKKDKYESRKEQVKQNMRKRRERESYSPQVNDLPEPPLETPSRQLLQGKRQSKKHRRRLHATIKKLEAKNATLKRKMETYKRRCNRLLLEKMKKKRSSRQSNIQGK
ncbi:unnamed protein product [Psylliodes chrysocephalus]|uniref:Uncharacterized protein n=1 Tax=Psylliodes chrysocephalus TaxID=3402493 RepID=A0A9P0GHF5_9CUCU|nr:unnamed protein product [Psylliodes chrysocephala]